MVTEAAHAAVRPPLDHRVLHRPAHRCHGRRCSHSGGEDLTRKVHPYTVMYP